MRASDCARNSSSLVVHAGAYFPPRDVLVAIIQSASTPFVPSRQLDTARVFRRFMGPSNTETVCRYRYTPQVAASGIPFDVREVIVGLNTSSYFRRQHLRW